MKQRPAVHGVRLAAWLLLWFCALLSPAAIAHRLNMTTTDLHWRPDAQVLDVIQHVRLESRVR